MTIRSKPSPVSQHLPARAREKLVEAATRCGQGLAGTIELENAIKWVRRAFPEYFKGSDLCSYERLR